MRDFLTGGALTAGYMLIVTLLYMVHPWLPFIGFGIVVVTLFVCYMRKIIEMVKSGEIVHVNQFWF